MYPCFVSELNEKNVLNVLHKAKFSDADWYKLGSKLVKNDADLRAIRAHYCDAGDCMIDMVAQWLRNDVKASWTILAEALDNVTGCETAAAEARQNAGTGMYTLCYVWLFIIQGNSIRLQTLTNFSQLCGSMALI